MRAGRWLAVAAAIAIAVPSVAQAQLWYNGEFNGVNGLSSERNTLIPQSMTYDNFVVTGAGWTINSVFGDFLSNFTWVGADWEIRSGISAGDGGTLLYSGSNAAVSQVGNGFDAFGLTGYRATISGLSVFLAPGTYWLGIAGIGSGNGRAFVSTTSGTNGVNPVTDGDAAFNSTFFSRNFVFDEQGNLDYAYGVNGTAGPQEVVPEPATLTLLATGLAGMAAARRRKAAQA